jgi:UDP-N-acetylglucosamine enolpyruvyl transferase
MDVKIAACETLIREINKLENWYLEDLKSSLKMFNHFEATVNYLQINLSKKLKRDTSSLDSNSNHNDPVENKKTSFTSLGAKLTKSVEKMNAFSLVKT